MNLAEINRLTIEAYNKTAKKYHSFFKNEVHEKKYDRMILDQFSSMVGKDGKICDAGCGPSGQYGEYLFKKGYEIIGIDISPTCIEIAKNHLPGIDFRTMDMMQTDFKDQVFDGIVCYYSIIFTPKNKISRIFKEFNRILKPGGKVLIVVKKGQNEGIIDDAWYEGNSIYFTEFLENELKEYFLEGGFSVDYFHTRKPYEDEINVERIYAIGTKKQDENPF